MERMGQDDGLLKGTSRGFVGVAVQPVLVLHQSCTCNCHSKYKVHHSLMQVSFAFPSFDERTWKSVIQLSFYCYHHHYCRCCYYYCCCCCYYSSLLPCRLFGSSVAGVDPRLISFSACLNLFQEKKRDKISLLHMIVPTHPYL